MHTHFFQYYFFMLFLSIIAFCSCKNNSIKTSSSEHGYRYEIIKSGNGPKPQGGDMVLIRHGGYVGEVEVFSSDTKRGMPISYTIPKQSYIDSLPIEAQKGIWPVFDAATLIGVGDSIYLWMPLDSLQQRDLPMGVDKNTKEMKIFMTLVEITSPEKEEAKLEALKATLIEALPEVKKMVEREIQKIPDGNPEGELIALESGVKIWVREKGMGGSIELGKALLINYYGAVMNGESFDNSFKNGDYFRITPGRKQIVTGLEEGILNLRHGAKALIYVPSEHAYGEAEVPNSGIKPNSDLVFYLEIQ